MLTYDNANGNVRVAKPKDDPENIFSADDFKGTVLIKSFSGANGWAGRLSWFYGEITYHPESEAIGVPVSFYIKTIINLLLVASPNVKLTPVGVEVEGNFHWNLQGRLSII